MSESAPEQHRHSWVIARLGCGCLPFLLFATLFFCVSASWIKAVLAFFAIISLLAWRDAKQNEAVTRAVEMIAENERLYHLLTQEGQLTVGIRPPHGRSQ